MKRTLPLAVLAIAVVLPTASAGRPLSAGSAAKAASNSVTYTDSTQEDPNAPDITTVVVSNDDTGLLTFQINVSNRPQFTQDMLSEIYLDTDMNPATGDPQALGTDYIIQLLPGHVGMFMWDPTRSNYINAPLQSTLISSYPSTGPVIKINASDIGNPKSFNFITDVISGITVDSTGTPDFTNSHADFAPDLGHGFWNYTIKISTPLTAIVGPGATISLRTATGAPVRSLKAGSVTLTIHDRSKTDNFHLVGPGGVNRKTSVIGRRTTVWLVNLVPGVYHYSSDTHPSLKGTFTVVAAA